jgi:hypothetical protein
MTFNQFYYFWKPLIPRRVQIGLRRLIVARKRARYSHVWPIDDRAGRPPEGWTGWPEGKKFALVLTHDVETFEGYEKCFSVIQLEERMGFRSSFNFVAMKYEVSSILMDYLKGHGFEVGVHGLYHDGKYYTSKETFLERAPKINEILKKWGAVGFRSPSMQHNLEWIGELDIEYDASTFDTDPFEPQPDGVGTLFPFWVPRKNRPGGYVELPYTLPQDFTLFIMMQEKDITLWKKKLDWIADKGGMALLNVHPDYQCFRDKAPSFEEYPSKFYEELLAYIKNKYSGQFWHVLPKEIAKFWAENVPIRKREWAPEEYLET